MSVPTAGLFNTAYRGMMVSQAGLNVVNNNITNANTPGYSRQRVDVSTSDPLGLPLAGRIGYMGQGPNLDGISRSHDNYIDAQIQSQSSNFKLHDTRANLLSQIEGLMGEPQGAGISTAINEFFDAAQALSVGPNIPANRTKYMQTASQLLQTFQDVGEQVNNLRTNITGSSLVAGSIGSSLIAVTAADINTKLQSIRDLNQEIASLSFNESQPNDLLDRRDQLLKELTEKIDVTVDYGANNNINVSLGSNRLIVGSTLVDTLSVVANGTATQFDTPAFVQLTNSGTNVTGTIAGGELGGYISMGGVGSSTLTTPRSLLVDMDDLFNEIATQVNTLQAGGIQLDGTGTTAGTDDRIFNPAAATDLPLFTWSINATVLNNPALIASGQGGGVGDGRQALAVAQLRNQSFAGIGNQTFEGYFNNTISELGVTSKAEQQSAENYSSILDQYVQQQQSLQGVNVEEEMVNLLKYQRAFEASSRALKAMDETIQSILSIM